MSVSFELRDPIHGFIERSPRICKIIDTKLFQRLRRIKQLAMASLVYPGALHTRFDHSIGVMHVAKKLSAKLDLSPAEQEIVAFAALLHDVGHGPYSHVSEEVLRGLTGNKQAHEQITAKIILESPELDGPLSGDERREIVSLLGGTGGDSLLKWILSGPIDVDKQDYLLRDSYFCGVKYGVYDLDRLIQTLRTHYDKHDRMLAITEDGVHALEQFVIAKYHMISQVYRHRLRLITDSMIVRGIELGITHDKIGWLRDLYSFDNTAEFLDRYLSWDDDRLTRSLLDESSGYANTMFRRLAERRLFKQIFKVSVTELDPLAKNTLLGLDQLTEKQITTQIEKSVADSNPELKLDENLVIAKIVKLKSPAETEGSIIVLRIDGSPIEFSEASTLFRSIDAATQDQFLAIYAPILWASESEMKKARERFRAQILPILNDLLKAKGGLFKDSPGVSGANREN